MRRRLSWTTRALAAAWLATAQVSGPARAEQEGDGPAPSPAAAEMLESMREKGLLTEDEYEELYRRQAKYESQHNDESKLPGWLQNWTFGGDVRFRIENRNFGDLPFDETYHLGSDNVDVITNRGLGDETRARLRLRLGAEKQVVESLTFGVRIATSSESSFGTYFNAGGTSFGSSFPSDPRSENVTFGDFFSAKSIFVDRLYLRWQPSFAPSFALTAGKIPNPFVSDHFSGDFLVWDNDIQPEGVAARYRFDFIDEKLWMDARSAFFTLQERDIITLNGFDSTTNTVDPVLPDIDQQNPFLIGFQGGLYARPLPWLQPGVRVSYYDLQGIGTRLAAAMEDLGNGGTAIDKNPLFRLLGPTNPLFENGKSDGRTKELVVDAYATMTPWGERWSITPFFQWMSLIDANSENDGFAVGADLGTPDFLKLTVMYAWIGRNATISLFTDSDAYEGLTNVKGWYVAAERNLTKGVRLRGAYMLSHQLQANCDENVDALCDTATSVKVLAPYRQTTLDRSRWQLDLLVDF